MARLKHIYGSKFKPGIRFRIDGNMVHFIDEDFSSPEDPVASYNIDNRTQRHNQKYFFTSTYNHSLKVHRLTLCCSNNTDEILGELILVEEDY